MTAKIVDIFTGKPRRKTRVRRRRMSAHHQRVVLDLVNECREFGDPDYHLFAEIHDDVCDDELALIDILAIYLVRKKLNSRRR